MFLLQNEYYFKLYLIEPLFSSAMWGDGRVVYK